MTAKRKAERRLPYALIAVALVLAQAAAQSQATYSVPVYTITPSGQTLSNDCYRLRATVAPASGYSNDATYSLYAGFQYATTPRNADEIFFSEFEECGP